MSIESLTACDDPARFRLAFKAVPDRCQSGSYLNDSSRYLDLAMDPCWQPMEYWVQYDGELPICRISARISSVDPERGYIGLVACDGSIPNQRRVDFLVGLIELAMSWLASRGVTHIYAPVDCNTWLKYRLMANADDEAEQPFGWEPTCDPDLESALKMTGFDTPESALPDRSETGRYHTRVFRSVFRSAMRVLEPHYQRAVADGFTFRPFGQDGRNLSDEMEILHKIAIPSFSRQFLFEPVDLSTFKRIYASGEGQLDLSPSAFIIPPSDHGIEVEPVGFLFGFVDRGYVVVKTVAVLPDQARNSQRRKWSAASALLYQALNHGDRHQLRGGIAALVHEDGSANTLEKWLAWASDWTRRYELFAKQI